MSINKRIKDWAINNNYKQKDLVNTAKISTTVASRIFNDVQTPALETLVKLANAYNLDLNYIITGKYSYSYNVTTLPIKVNTCPEKKGIIRRIIEYVF